MQSLISSREEDKKQYFDNGIVVLTIVYRLPRWTKMKYIQFRFRAPGLILQIIFGVNFMLHNFLSILILWKFWGRANQNA